MGGDVILLVENNPADFMLIRKALDAAKVPHRLEVVRTVPEAIAYLAGDGDFFDRLKFPLPQLMLLNLRMPGLNSFDVLHWLRQMTGARGLFIVAVVSPEDIGSVKLAYSLGARSYIVKPTDFQNTEELSELVKAYWQLSNNRPQHHRRPPD